MKGLRGKKIEEIIYRERMEEVAIISGTAHPELGKKIASILGKECIFPEIYHYPTGDFELSLPTRVRRKTVFIIQTFPAKNVPYFTLELLFLTNAAYKASAEEVTVIVPHLGWDQSDKKWRGRMPIVGELIAAFIYQCGAKRYVGVQFHSPQFPGFFPLPVIVDHLVADQILLDYVLKEKLNKGAVLLPGDLGFSKIARKLADKLGIPLVEVEKERTSGHKVKIHKIYGSVKGKRLIIWDDKIVEGTTIRAIAEYVEKRGAKEITVIATHGLFGGKAIENLNHPLIKRIIVTDSIPHEKILNKLPIVEVSIAPLLAEAIREIATGGSISRLFQGSVLQTEQ